MKDDTISRQAAVSRISDLLILELKGRRLPTWDEVNEAINELPSIQPEPRWISVTEGLPEADKRVLICNDEGRYLVGFIKSWRWGNEWSYQLDMNNYDAYDEQEQGKLVAWMPLPEPYRKE